ncbi:MAG TPA: stage III sporulation protein AB [Hungateiclostridium thermocellum]|jgi:stage III sporulation protein AB|uniref:Stage III sporulation protein AB n=2 Tax=Acetivibrio thermocellus TaxID=1515 RepID=A3DDQ0_ACET2|nr:stage III sporulation protein SpoIIIAB [Acetivibrio thermocellus]CDG35536.1 stage III sporulation protein spoIIIAB [Acetivibrio thermocellus BC1]ABN52079.1 stage III sporulation protein AB [Acetivibrio thermocellus ATCC 27405]ADU74440.1 stage III sporulation protein AB [Acetivibrio thermocellus DSM 1313]ALX08383.1 stage III sporulation protein AB [Acetivibrio thermocellus AD2]ANV76132.1 stage III sporulation protein AB [Acetivibrio thermocellus DSM 2360]
MLLKIIGSLIVFMSSSLLGYMYSRRCSKRPAELRALQGYLQMFETEISFMSNVLKDAFTKIYMYDDSSVAVFFKGTVEALENDTGITAGEAWAKAVKENIKNTSLNKEDEEIIISFGKMLGSSDVEGQIKNIRLTINQLKLQEQKAEELRAKNEAMYRNLGILGGLAIIIILF